MKRTKVDWSNAVDEIVGPCIVCGKEVRFLVPDDRPDPSLLYHSTCDMMPMVREHLKTSAHPDLMPSQYVIVKPPKPAAAPTPAPAPAVQSPTLATPPTTPPITPK